MDDLIEMLAREIEQSVAPRLTWREALGAARAAERAYEVWLQAAGMVVVPVEPDDDGVEAGMVAFWDMWPGFREWVASWRVDNNGDREGQLHSVPPEPFQEFYRALVLGRELAAESGHAK